MLKPKQSAFFGTTLDTLLRESRHEDGDPHRHRRRQLRAVQRQRRLHARPEVVHPVGLRGLGTPRRKTDYALQLMKKVVKADIRPSTAARSRGAGMMRAPRADPVADASRDGDAGARRGVRARPRRTDRALRRRHRIFAQSRPPASGSPTDDEIERDHVIMVEVVVEVFDREWWAQLSRAARTAVRPGRSACPRNCHRAGLRPPINTD